VAEHAWVEEALIRAGYLISTGNVCFAVLDLWRPLQQDLAAGTLTFLLEQDSKYPANPVSK
jgi:hypothetical protein